MRISGLRAPIMAQITQKDIAAALSVSRETVTKALSGDPKVADDTRQAVLDKAGALGYTPNLLASSLASRHSRLVGLIVPHIAHPLFSTVAEKLYRECRRRGYTMIPMISFDSRHDEMECVKMLLSMRVAAIAFCVMSSGLDGDVCALLQDRGIPVVFFDRKVVNAAFCNVVPDYRAMAFRATTYALSCGYVRPVFLCGVGDDGVEKERCRGYLDALTEFCPEADGSLIVPCGASRDEGYNVALKLLQADIIPDFILTSDGAVALGVCDAANVAGFAIPEQLGVIALDEPSGCGMALSEVTCVFFSATRIADTIVDLLFGALAGEVGPLQRTVPGELHLRKSCR